MFFKLLNLRVRKEIEELKSLHRIEMAEKEAESKRSLQDKEIELVRLEKDLKRDQEVKTREVISLLKIESEQRMTQMKIDNERALDKVRYEASMQINTAKENLLKEHYDRLSSELTKLHGEGDANSKFTRDLAIAMVSNTPERKSRKTKVLLTSDAGK